MIIAFCFCNTNLAHKNKHGSAQLKQIETDWHHAYVTHDIHLIEKALADDFIDLGRTGGRINKKQVLDNFGKDSSQYEYCEPYDMEFKIYTNSAIVIGRTKEKGISGDKPFANEYFWHDVFIKTKQGWKCVLASVALIPPKK
jgi:hypothetical protein